MHTNQISSCGFVHAILLTQWTEGQSEGTEEIQDRFKKCVVIAENRSKAGKSTIPS